MSRLVRAVIAAVALVAGVAGVAVPAAHAAAPALPNRGGPLLWTAPGTVDTAPIDALACPSLSLCVAVDRAGTVLWSSDPAGGPRSWFAAKVDGGNEMTGIACPSSSLCVAVDGAGNVITSQNPTGGQAAWTVAKIDSSPTQTNTDNAGPILLRGVACPSTGLCVAVDGAGNALASTEPTGGAGAWTITHADANRSYGCQGTGLVCQPPLVGVSCPSTAQCAAVDFSGNVLTTQSPATGPWSSTPTGGGGLSSLWGISCPVAGFCATVNGTAGRVITFNPAIPTAQQTRRLPDPAYGIWCGSPSLCLAAAQTRGGLSGVLGSYNPPGTWSLSSLGAINTVACPSASLCLAGNDEGEIAAGLTTRAIASLLGSELLSTRHLPTTTALARARGETLIVTSPIAARVALAWTLPGPPAAAPMTLATASHAFHTPGTATLKLRLTAAGVRLVRAAAGRLTVTAAATFTAGTGSWRVVRRLTFAHRAGRQR